MTTPLSDLLGGAQPQQPSSGIGDLLGGESARPLFDFPDQPREDLTGISEDVDNLIRGGITGAINWGLIGAADLAVAAGQIALPKPVEQFFGLPQARERIHATQAEVKQSLDPRGTAGAVGEVVGGFAGMVLGNKNPYAILNSAGMQAMARVSPRIAARVLKGLGPGATFTERLVAQSIGSGAVDATQVVDVLSDESYTWEDRLKIVGTTALLSGGAAALAAWKQNPALARQLTDPSQAPKEGPPAAANEDIQARINELTVKADEIVAKKKATGRLRRAAQVEWEQQNPELDWRVDLTKEQRSELIENFRVRTVPPAEQGAPKPAGSPEATPAAIPGEPAEAPPVARAVASVAEPEVGGGATRTVSEPTAISDLLPPSPTAGVEVGVAPTPEAAIEGLPGGPAGVEAPSVQRSPVVVQAEIDDIADELDTLIEQLDNKTITQAEFSKQEAALSARQQLLAKEKKSLAAPTTVVRPGLSAADKKALDAVVITQGKDLGTFDRGQLINTARNIKSAIQSIPESAREPYVKELDRVLEHVAMLDQPRVDPTKLNMPPQLGGALAGFVAGYTVGDSDEERLRNALYGLAAGGLGANFMAKRLTQVRREMVSPELKEIRKVVKSSLDVPLDQRVGLNTWLNRVFAGWGNRARGIELGTESAGLREAGFTGNAGKKARLFGLFYNRAHEWIFDKPSWVDDAGNIVELFPKGVQQIVHDGGGDLQHIGDVMAAMRALELAAQPNPRNTPVNLNLARVVAARAPATVHKAREEMRGVALALADVGRRTGLLSDETYAKFAAEEFYAPLRRVFGETVGKPGAEITTKGGRTEGGTTIAQPAKKLKGNKLPIQNPAEALLEIIPRWLRASELNDVAATFFAGIEGASPDVKKAFRLVSRPQLPEGARFTELGARLHAEALELGSGMTRDEAHNIARMLSDESLGIADDVVTYWQGGQPVSYHVPPLVARAFRSLQSRDWAAVRASLDIPIKITTATRTLITGNPFFILFQAFRDNWQYYMNGAFGGTPGLGLLSAFFRQGEGWWKQMTNHPEVQLFRAFGAGGDSVAGQSLELVQTRRSLIQRVEGTRQAAPLPTAVKQLKDLHPLQAYSTIMAPIADAARIGAYLHERGRGAAVADAVWKAKQAGAIYSNRGDLVAAQAFGKLTLFFNPAIQSFTASAEAFKRDPISYVLRGMVGISIPSALLWAKNQGDEEIAELRKTEAGRRFWFTRVGGQIVKLPKPIFDGQFWGTSVELYLDKKFSEDPDTMRGWIESVHNDAAINLFPMLFSIPASVIANKDLAFGSKIVPEGFGRNVDSQYRTKPGTSEFAKTFSGAVAPITEAVDNEVLSNAFSPAGVDYLVRSFGGKFGVDIAKSLSLVIEKRDGSLPRPLDELPFIHNVFPKFPTVSVGSINEFYRHADRAERKANTLNYLVRNDPDQVLDYIQRHGADIALYEAYRETRTELVDMRKALVDIEQAPSDVMTDKDKKEYSDTIIRGMIDLAKQANAAIRDARQTVSASPPLRSTSGASPVE